MTRPIYSILINLIFFVWFHPVQSQEKSIALIEESINALNEVLIHDITSPPVASRTYAYSLVALYEAGRHMDNSSASYAGRINEFSEVVKPVAGESYDFTIAGLHAFYNTARALVFSKTMFDEQFKKVFDQLSRFKTPASVRMRSVEFGRQVADNVVSWSRLDKYAYTRGLTKFTPSQTDGSWQQTAPDFMEAVEPYWNQLRPMVINKADQFLIPKPCVFNSELFQQQCREVYETSLKLTGEQKAIADFWDCNPFATQTIGHMAYSVKKISPAGHWIGITGVAIKKRKDNFSSAIRIYSMVAIGIYDAIICAWDEKYRSNYIRPITAIQRFHSPTWQPHLQTPPFPEYPSGHSVISNAAATVLTFFFGENFAFADDVEKPYGLPVRNFRSFTQAADEAAISRLYGGIHFKEAIENGRVMGRNVGQLVLEKLAVKNR
jgi:hypothetical protein